MNLRRVFSGAILVVAVVAATFGWYRYVAHPKPVACEYCSRPLHSNLRVVAEIAGKQAEVCCARCAISEANQQHKPLRLIAVHDYATGRSLAPQNAWFVEGSRAMACDRDAMPTNEMKSMDAMPFDRCSPATFAFAERPAAEAFAAQNGGAVMALAQLMREVRFQ